MKNIGRGFIDKVVEERRRGGDYRSLEDFCARMYGTELNKRAMENLIKCGACDCFSLRRSQLLAVYEAVMDAVAQSRRRNVEGQMGLFDTGSSEQPGGVAVPVPELPEIAPQERMAMEKEVTGLYLSGHPMDGYRGQLRARGVAAIGEILTCFEEGEETFTDGQNVQIAGIIQQMKMKTTRNNTIMAYVTLEDDTGDMELLAFSSAVEHYSSLLNANTAVVVAGRISVRDEKAPQIIVNQVYAIGEFTNGAPQAAMEQGKPQRLFLRLPSEESRAWRRVRPVLNMFPGKTPVVLYFEEPGVKRKGFCLVEEDLLKELREILGAENVVCR